MKIPVLLLALTAPCSSATGGSSIVFTATGQPVQLPPCDLSTVNEAPPANG
jgi:hypothetical protein